MTGIQNTTDVPLDLTMDSDLSFQARGVYLYLLSLPENAEYDLLTEGRCGKQAITTALSELIAKGWLPPDTPIRRRYYAKKDIPDSLRWEIWERDNFTCQFCESRRMLTIDHIHPESKGGSLDPLNLQTLCKRCNSLKGAKLMEGKEDA